ncbi:hypothetical protein FACS1894159_11640 [Bacteroidia bacterium]|nr:hypothetical protein FACS1894159_11640 [Bacteroidia bacterium]
MEKQKIDFFLMSNADKFPPMAIPTIKDKLEKLDDDKLYLLQGGTLRNPTTILIIAILLGWDRFFLEDIGLGILKVLTCYGFGIWGIIDMFTAMDRTRQFNYRKFIEMTSYM